MAAPQAFVMSRGDLFVLEQSFDCGQPQKRPLPDFDPATTTVEDLKTTIAKMTGVPAEAQVLYSGPVALVNNRLLSEYDQLASRPIVLEPALQGGCPEVSCYENCGCISCGCWE